MNESESLSPTARLLGPIVSVTLRPLLRRGFAPRRGILALIGGAIGQAAAGTSLQRSTLGGVPVEIATPPRYSGAATIIYLHGGAYVAMSARGYRRLVTQLAAATGCRVAAVDYRLAPEHPYPAALDDSIAAYTAAREQRPEERFVLAGDSAGGGLTIATAIALRDRGAPMPAALICVAPWVDLTCSGESMTTRVRRERILSPAGLAADAHRYAGREKPSSPLVSPLFADLNGLPPMLIQVGDDEVLLDDSTRLANSAHTAGVPVDLQVWPHLWHDWHLFAGLLLEADAALRAMDTFVRDTLSRS